MSVNRYYLKIVVVVITTTLMCVMFVPLFASALSNGVYLADNKSHYSHPKTGVIEDSGGEHSYALGQSMTESAVYSKALVEVDGNGNIFVTVRIQMQDNCKDASFTVDGNPTSVSLMKEDNVKHTADWRIKVPSVDSIIRAKMYVIPMGRTVIWYMTVSNFIEGRGNFEVSIKMPKNKPIPKVEEPVDDEANAANNIAAQKLTEQKNSQNGKSSVEDNSSDEAAKTPVPQTNTTTESIFSNEKTSSEAEKTTLKGIEEFDQSGAEVVDKTEKKKMFKKNIVITVASVFTAIGIGVAIIVAVLKKKEII